MGNNTVAVLYNDMSHEIAAEGEIGKRMAWAMNNWNRVSLEGFFRVGRVVSRDHSSAHQVVVVHAGGGDHIADANDLPHIALSMMADCLERHGWKVTKPRKKKTDK